MGGKFLKTSRFFKKALSAIGRCWWSHGKRGHPQRLQVEALLDPLDWLTAAFPISSSGGSVRLGALQSEGSQVYAVAFI